MNWKLILFCFMLAPFMVKADLRPNYLSIKLTSERPIVSNGDVIPFWLEFQNTDSGERPVIFPGNKKSGKKVVFFSFFSVKDDYYTEVFRESQEITIDTSSRGGTGFRYLKSGEKFRFPVFFNDEKNYDSHIEAHHRLPNLPEGDYEVLAWYQPWNDDMAEYAFNPIDPFGHEIEEKHNPTFLDMPMEGTQSNYLKITIRNGFQSLPTFLDTDNCPTDCKFCQSIEEEDWKKVRSIIDKQTYYHNKLSMNRVDSNWRLPHKNVAWLGPNPQAILASLPTYTSRTVIFENSEGFHYYSMRWQLGIVYSGRSRFSRVFYWMGFKRSLIETSELDYCKLVFFAPY